MMAHKWDQPVNRHVAHSVTCTLCGVFVERVFEGERGVNYNTPLGGERSRGLAPKCPGKITVTEEDPNQLSLLDLAADAATEEAITEAEEQRAAEAADDEETIVVDMTAGDPLEHDEEEDADEEPDDLATLVEKYEAMNRKALDKLAAGLVKNYKKLSKDALAFELAIKEQQAAAHAA